MIKTSLKKLYEGSLANVTLLVAALEQENIFPIVKNRGESGLMAGFAGEVYMQQEVFVFEDQWQKAQNILKELELN